MSKGKSVKKNAAKKQLPKNPRQQFNAHCQAIKKQHLRIDNLRQQQTMLVERFQQQALPLEKQYIGIVYQKTERLLSFLDKKSLAAYQRDDLFQWITEDIMYLEDYPFSEHLDIQALREKLADTNLQYADKSLDENRLALMREMLVDEFPFVHQLSDEELRHLILNPKEFVAKAEQERAGPATHEAQAEEFEDEMFEDDEDFFFDEDEQEDIAAREQRQQGLAALFGTSAANRMYKRLAMVFHPDREMDEATKQDKHHLMVQLAQARKNHDIWTIINLYQEHIDPDGGFEEKDLPAINQLLSEQVENLKSSYREQEHSSDPLTSMLWARFGHSSTERVLDAKLAKHVKELQMTIDEEKQIIAELTSLKVLKRYLAERAQLVAEEEMDFMADLFR